MTGFVGFDTDRDSTLESADGAEIIARELMQRLMSDLGDAWLRGWQPLDLHRLASSWLGQRQQTVLRNAIADEMCSYAAESVDPRWRSQLAEIGALPGPSASTSSDPRRLVRMPLYRTDRPAWTKLLHQVSLLVRNLPAVQLLIPPPGRGSADTGRIGADADSTAANEVDDRILRRVRALLAKAESTQYPEEADTYTAAAQRLMTRHRIDSALLAASAGTGSPDSAARRIGIDTPYEAAKVMLLTAVADANACRTVWSKGFGFCTVVGAAPDLDVTERLFTSLLLQAATAMRRAGAPSEPGARSRTSRAFRTSFLRAYAVRIGERLGEASEAEVAVASAEPGGSDLVPVLAARAEEVDRAVDALFGALRRATTSSTIDPDGWASGCGAADMAHLGSHTTGEIRS